VVKERGTKGHHESLASEERVGGDRRDHGRRIKGLGTMYFKYYVENGGKSLRLGIHTKRLEKSLLPPLETWNIIRL